MGANATKQCHRFTCVEATAFTKANQSARLRIFMACRTLLVDSNTVGMRNNVRTMRRNRNSKGSRLIHHAGCPHDSRPSDGAPPFLLARTLTWNRICTYTYVRVNFDKLRAFSSCCTRISMVFCLFQRPITISVVSGTLSVNRSVCTVGHFWWLHMYTAYIFVMLSRY